MWRRKEGQSKPFLPLWLSVAGSQASVAMAVRANKSAASAGVFKRTAERSEVWQPKRSQPRADMTKQLHWRRPFIPTDLVQNTAEYLGRVAGLLSFRGVSTEWQGAVSDAVGFLNGRCWNRLHCHHQYYSSVDSEELWTRLRLDDPHIVARCAVLCLRPRLETVTCGRPWMRTWFPLRLLGETNEALVTLSLHDSLRSADDLSCLLGCVALRELSLQGTQVTNESFAGLGPLLARLHKLDLSGCGAEGDIEPRTGHLLARAQLGGLRRRRSTRPGEAGRVGDAGCDRYIRTTDLSILRQCPRLVTLSAKGDITALESIIHAAPPSLVDCRLHIDRPVSALDSRSLSCLRRSTVLKFRDLDNASLQGLEEIPSLEQLDLECTALTMCDRWQAAVR
jgi:hypothetical protein